MENNTSKGGLPELLDTGDRPLINALNSQYADMRILVGQMVAAREPADGISSALRSKLEEVAEHDVDIAVREACENALRSHPLTID